MLKRIAILFITLSINGCGDEYRYHCQDPKHFGDAQCQKPACEFSQTCPDYLIAPVLEKKIEGNSVSPPNSTPGSTAVNCR